MASTDKFTTDGTYQACATGEGHVLFTPHEGIVEYRIGSAVPAPALVGHIAPANVDRPLFLEAGETLYVKSRNTIEVAITADNPVAVP
jgi:hypothetical protein